MSLKIFLIRNMFLYFLIVILMLGVTSCAPKGITPSPYPTQKPKPRGDFPVEPVEKQPSVEEPKPRMIASLQLTQQAQSLIESRQADGAIRILEKAVALDPLNGRNYYYLSEAWLIKENTEQAASFNELASIHLSSDEKWRQRIANQKQRIKEQADLIKTE